MIELPLDKLSSWIIIPGGQRAMYRQAFSGVKNYKDLDYSLATANEVVSCSLGNTFPWGKTAKPPQNWDNAFQSVYGLYHSHWFVTKENHRIGGAYNVERSGSGALRHLMLSPASSIDNRQYLEDNEGWALATDLDDNSSTIYHKLQLYAAQHISTDGGLLLVSPSEANKVYIGLGGQCIHCRNRESVTLCQLKETFPDLEIEMFPDLME
jgi:hypothetical protein